MVPRVSILLLVSVATTLTGWSQQGQGTGRASATAGNIANLQWSTETRQEGNAQVTTRTFQSLLAQGPRTLVIEEERTVQISPDAWRTTRTTYNLDSRGRRRPVEVVEEQRTAVGENIEEINRTVATPDGSGEFRVIRQEVVRREETQGGSQTDTTVYAPDINGGMDAVEIIAEKEVTRPSGEIEVRRTTSTPKQGRWIPAEQRLKVTTQDDEGRPLTEWEQIFRRNARGKLALSEQTQGSYSRSEGGSEEWTVATQTAPRGDGRLELARRVTTTRTPTPDGGEQTVQEVMALRPGQRSEGLVLAERTITSSRPVGENQAEVTIEVLARSANGGLRQVSRSSTVVATEPEKAEQTETEAEKPPAEPVGR